ncbi:MAG: glucosyltransferase domain-containing protein, partial [Acetatifactor sp.]|nr:glucosyltransferase domain-containing protein [Acetatifactor sp.]
MKKPSQIVESIKNRIPREWHVAFCSTFCIGILTHLPAMISDIPNHDGLASMHFDQNMITSGRWFLSVACGPSSYFTLPWIIGLLSLAYLGFAGVLLTDLLELKSKLSIILACGLLAVFPSLASTFAYIFTMDGYMLAVFLAVLSVWLTKRFRFGFVAGGISLAFSMGIYQVYLATAIFLCMYAVVTLWIDEGELGTKIMQSLRFLFMGAWGSALYYILLRLFLFLQGKELGTYQGINGMSEGVTAQSGGFLHRIAMCYRDFVAFTVRGNVFFNNYFSLCAL